MNTYNKYTRTPTYQSAHQHLNLLSQSYHMHVLHTPALFVASQRQGIQLLLTGLVSGQCMQVPKSEPHRYFAERDSAALPVVLQADICKCIANMV
jgi:hypothetical protein